MSRAIAEKAQPATILTYEDSLPFLDWHAAVDALQRGHLMPRAQLGDLLLGPKAATLLNRAAYIEGLGYAVKAETIVPGNPAKGLPSIQGTVLLHDADTGSVRAIIESKLVTEYKTAADSVLGARLLARPESRHLLIIGAGTVAASLVHAYGAVFPNLERISIWARRPEQAEALIRSFGTSNIEFSAAGDLQSVVEKADIISTATMARQPILFGDWVRAGTHVDLIGGFTPDMREADDALIAKSQVFVDCRETTMECVGDLTQPIEAGVIDHAHVKGDLYDIVTSTTHLRSSAKAVTVFKNGGGAHLDLMISAYIASAVSSSAADAPRGGGV